MLMNKEEPQKESGKVLVEDVDKSSVFDDVALVDPKGSAISALKEMFKRAQICGLEGKDSE